ncbi:MAG: cation-translocating P-type ATPase [Streptococcaceae bacterium]|jgi:Ca2+-transporting ATPase|nr:cation-translocating P-type ATPase [Streptococcaceae bacterium]
MSEVERKGQLEQAFYTQEASEVLTQLDSSRKGLTTQEVNSRLELYGPNALEEGKTKSLFVKFLEQFKDLMIIILLIAAALSVITSGGEDVSDAIIILAVVLINAIFGVMQENKAEAAIEALKSMSSPAARVHRDGHVEEIKSTELVPGDVVALEAGDVVPADMRLLEVNSLKIEEAALTGESVPVEKALVLLADAETPIGDRINMAYQNSNVTYGRGLGVVTNTGMSTEVGKIAGMIANADETETPLKRNLNRLSKVLTYAILGIAAVTFTVHLIRGGHALEGLMTAVALAVAAIPEGLPAIVTIVLALGTQVLAKRNSIVRKLPAVETLGSTEIIASDKTGTLTMNQMTVEKVFTNGQLLAATEAVSLDDMTLKIMTYSNDTKVAQDGKLIGDPTETALVQYGIEHNYDLKAALIGEPRVLELPFDSERKLMSTIHKLTDGRYLVATKGAPDQLIARTAEFLEHNQTVVIDDEKRQELLDLNTSLAKQALRVLAMAYKIIDAAPSVDELNSENIEKDLIFAGLVGMIDPERKEAAKAVATAKSAGIRPIMITGDHQDTAEAIAVRLGILEKDHAGDAVLTGAALNAMSDEEFAQKVDHYAVYARVSPEHKVRIVKAWQVAGKVVAMTGDGVNDAPALKQADIGIGMGITGTEVSKGASDMVLADDNFATIIVAVEEGRKVFSNIQKTIQYLLSANMAEVMTIFLATLFSWDVLLPVHLLWINLVTDTFPAIALGVEPAEPGVMNQKPRGRKASFFSGGVLGSIIYQGFLQGALTLGVYGFALLKPAHTIANTTETQAADLMKTIGGELSVRLSNHSSMISELQHADALTMAFATLGLIQLFHAFNVKSVYQSIFTVGPFKSKTFNWSILVSFILLMATIVIPGFNSIFHVSHLDNFQWGIVILGSFAMIVIVEIIKALQRAAGLDKK